MPWKWQKSKPGLRKEDGDNVAHATTEEIIKAKEMDLLTYLRNYEPDELVKISNDNYCTREHDSLKISNGKWHWFSRNVGGTTALDYLIHVKGYSFPAAVETILGRSLEKPPVLYKQQDRSSKVLLLPPRSENTRKVTTYLRSRGIHPAIIDFCYRNNLLYEGLPYHNAVFIGYDEKGVPRYAALRGTVGKFKGEATGSDKQYSFNIPAADKSNKLHLFEAAIDLLSYATMEYRAVRDWNRDHLLSLAGVFIAKREAVVPAALERYLKLHPEIDTIILHLDRDAVGRGAAQGIINELGKQYAIRDELPEYGKDVNDALIHQVMRSQTKEIQIR